MHIKKFDALELGRVAALCSRITINVFGDVGLSEWPEISPSFVRDKAYLVMKKHGEPLHFRTIARLIGEYNLSEKRAHPQTVHNELIKDSRFVLVGRGIYGLKEQGFEGGTVCEVIARILAENGAMSTDDIVREVQKRKISKRNTIVLNLQNRDLFERLSEEGSIKYQLVRDKNSEQ